jgi:ABC-type protease/lipase transport system fused ATPase/permease subunit
MRAGLIHMFGPTNEVLAAINKANADAASAQAQQMQQQSLPAPTT